MEQYQNDNQSMEYTIIDLRELILVLWKRKKMIISITLIAAILAGIFSFFVITPVYQSKLNIVINMPETYHTKYGDYSLPIKTNSEYFNLITSNDVLSRTISKMEYDNEKITIEKIRKRIKIDHNSNDETQNVFSVITDANNPEEARKLAECLYDSYVEFLNVITAEGAMDYYINLFSTELKSLEVSLESNHNLLEANEKLLAETSPTINQKEALNEIQKQINTSDFIVLEKVVNPNYTAIEANIIENKQSINSMEDTINVYNNYLGELEAIKSDIEQYFDTGNYEAILSSKVTISDISISLPSQPVTPSEKTSPSNAKNVCIGAVLGGMLAISIVLFRWWWQRGNVNDMKGIFQENVKDSSHNKVSKKKII